MSDDNKVEVRVSADGSAVAPGMDKAASAVKDGVTQMKAEMAGLGDAFKSALGPLKAFAALLAGGAIFNDGINATKQLTADTLRLSKALGVGMTEASNLNVALKTIGSSAETYTDANAKLTRQIRTNEAAVQAMGVQTRGTNGELLSGDKIMTSALTALGSYKEGTDRNLAGQQLFGKGAAEVTALLKLNSGVMEKAAATAQQLGLVIGPEQAAKTKAYKDSMEQVKLVLTGLENAIGQAVMPMLTTLAEWFAAIGPPVVQTFKAVMETLGDVFTIVLDIVKELWMGVKDAFTAIGDMITSVAGNDSPDALQIWKNALIGVKIAALGLKVGIVLAFEVIRGAVTVLVADLKGFAGVAKAVFTLDWGSVTSAWKAGTKGVEDALAESQKRILEKTAATAEQMQRVLMGGPLNEAKAGASSSKGTRSYTDPKAGKDGGKDPSRTGAWETELAEQKLHFQERMNLEGSFAQFGKQSELKFWQDKLSITTQGGAENLTVRRKLADLQLALGQEAFQHELASLVTREAAFKSNTQAKMVLVQQEAELVKQRFGQESKEYETVQKKIVEIKRAAIEQQKQIDMQRAQGASNAALAELQSREQLSQLEISLGTITQQELLTKQREFENQKNEIQAEALKQRQVLAMEDPDRNVVELERIHQEIQQLEREHQLKLGEIRNQSIRESARYTNDALNTMGSGFERVFAQAMQGSISLRGVMQGLWQSMASAVTSALSKMAADWLLVQMKNLILGKVVALSSIAGSAGEAGAAAVASTAAIPVVGPGLAPAAGAAAFAAAMSFAPMASAAGGYDIPGSINPITQLHANEMVLPAKHADVIRGMADGEGGGGGAVHVHFSGGIATDERAVRRFFIDNNSALVEAVRKARRDNK